MIFKFLKFFRIFRFWGVWFQDLFKILQNVVPKAFQHLVKKAWKPILKTFPFFLRNMLLMLSLILPDTFVRNTLFCFQCSHRFWKWPTPAKLYATLSLDPCQHPWTIISASSISAVSPRTSKDIWEKSLTSVLLALVICAKSNLDCAF